MKSKAKHGSKPMLATLPGIQALTRAIRFIPGGRPVFIEHIQLAMQNGSEPATRFWELFCELEESDRKKASLDDVCYACGVQPEDLMAATVSSAMQFGRDVGNMVAAAFTPKVVKKLGESALRIDGDYAKVAQKDRQAFLQGQGILPAPRSASVTVNANASANSQAAAAAAAEPSVPNFADDMSMTVRPAHALPASSDEDLPFVREAALVEQV